MKAKADTIRPSGATKETSLQRFRRRELERSKRILKTSDRKCSDLFSHRLDEDMKVFSAWNKERLR
jgi:hypothetical protein